MPIRVLVVDDSAFMRRVLTDLLQSDPDVQVVGTARDGQDALGKVAALAPDVITLDVEMPRLDGLATLAQLMASDPRPVIMVSSVTQEGADATLRALALGAVDFVPKPSGAISLDMYRTQADLVHKVKAAAAVGPERLRRLRAVAPEPERPVFPATVGPGAPAGQLSRLVVVAASTGGPGALLRLLHPLPARLAAGLLIVQHMPAGFTRSLAQHLDQATPLRVQEAAPGDRLVDGLALVAPGGCHLRLDGSGRVMLDDGPSRHGVRPAADVTMETLPLDLARGALVLVLTGMGMDGARGAKYLRDHGATVWAQDAASCVVYGMPRAVAELGLAEQTGEPEALAGWIVQRCGLRP